MDTLCRCGWREVQVVADGGPQQGQLAAAFDQTAPRFQLEQGRRTPAEFLITRIPPRDATHFTCELGRHILEQLGCLAVHAECRDDTKPMQRQRFVKTFGEAVRGRRVEHDPLLVHPL